MNLDEFADARRRAVSNRRRDDAKKELAQIKATLLAERMSEGETALSLVTKLVAELKELRARAEFEDWWNSDDD